MAEEKKGFWSKLFGTKKTSGCCSIKIEEETKDAGEEDVAGAKADPAGKQAESAPCCGGPKTPKGSGGCGCCG